MDQTCASGLQVFGSLVVRLCISSACISTKQDDTETIENGGLAMDNTKEGSLYLSECHHNFVWSRVQRKSKSRIRVHTQCCSDISSHAFETELWQKVEA